MVGGPIALGSDARAIAISPDGARAYVGHAGSSDVWVFDTATNTRVGSPTASRRRGS